MKKKFGIYAVIWAVALVVFNVVSFTVALNTGKELNASFALTLGTFPWMEPKPGSMGVPNPQYDIDLLTHDGRSAEDGEQGQIVIRTDRGKPLGLFKEYYRASELTEDAWHDGIYYTCLLYTSRCV